MSCDPTQLADLSKCFQCLDRAQAEAIRNYLLCQINENGGTGGGGTVQIYSTTDADPTGIVTPADPTKGAIFYQDPSLSIYNVWKWSVEDQAWEQTQSAESFARVLAASTTFYVRTDGSDSNSGLVNSAGGAWLTIQFAIDSVSKYFLNPGVVATIQVGDGTYTQSLVLRSLSGSGRVVINGNSTTPANVFLNTSSNTISCERAQGYTVQNMKLAASAGTAVSVSSGGLLTIARIDFGASSGGHMIVNLNAALVVAAGGYTISGGTTVHMYATRNSTIQVASQTVTLTGTPDFSVYFAFADTSGTIYELSVTFSGSATGTRYNVATNAVIYTNGGGANYFPGNVAGSVATGGSYS